MIDREQLFKKFSDLPITIRELHEMIDSIVDLFVYVTFAGGKMKAEIFELNKIHWNVFRHLGSSKLNFYKGMDQKTRAELLELIEIESKQGTTSWRDLFFIITRRVRLYKRIFSLTDADIKQRKHLVERRRSKFLSTFFIGAGILGTIYAAARIVGSTKKADPANGSDQKTSEVKD